jgi:predicted dienelactone hydrolase
MLMKRSMSCTIILLFVATLASCGTPAAVPPTGTRPQATTTRQQAAATVERVGEVTAVAEVTQEPVPFPLSEPGSYYTGKHTYTFEDASRDGRQIGITVFYPALRPEGSKGPKLLAGANRDPDLSGAPYPLIFTGQDSGDQLFKAHLATRGFVMAIVRSPGTPDYWDLGVIDHPRDILFVLDQIASEPLEGLEGVIDSDHVGVTGYSWDGLVSLAVSGARIDPEFYLSYCEQAPAKEPAFGALYLEITCSLAEMWDEFAAYVGDEITVTDDGLWQAVTDERIRAVLPMAGDGAWLFGERGLAMADRPVLMIQATQDSPYQPIEAAFIFEHLGTSEKFMVSFIDKTHSMVFEPESAKRMNHFATAFFGTYLQAKSEYRDYFSEEFVARFDDLAWGVYNGE